MQQEALALKNQGNKFFKEKNYLQAINLYTKSIELSPNNSILFSNRSRAYKQLGYLEQSYQDAKKAIQLDQKNIKGYFLLGEALVAQAQGSKDSKMIQEAIEKLKKSLTLCPSQNKSQYEERFIHQIYKAKKKLWLINYEKNQQKKRHLRKYFIKLVQSDQSLEMNQKDEVNQKVQKLLDQNICTQKIRIPEALICPLTKSIMKDPICNEMGHSYSRQAYIEHIGTAGKLDPITKKQLKYNFMYSNINVKKAIQHFLSKHPWAYEQIQI